MRGEGEEEDSLDDGDELCKDREALVAAQLVEAGEELGSAQQTGHLHQLEDSQDLNRPAAVHCSIEHCLKDVVERKCPRGVD